MCLGFIHQLPETGNISIFCFNFYTIEIFPFDAQILDQKHVLETNTPSDLTPIHEYSIAVYAAARNRFDCAV